MRADKTKKAVWLDKSEYVAQMNIGARALYYLGVIKQKRFVKYDGKPLQIYAGGFYRSTFGFRWWHPLSLAIAFILLLVEFIARVFKSFVDVIVVIKSLDRQLISVNKPLIRD